MRVSYQISITAEEQLFTNVAVCSDRVDHIRVYHIKDAVMDALVTFDVLLEDYITHEPGLMPDILRLLFPRDPNPDMVNYVVKNRFPKISATFADP